MSAGSDPDQDGQRAGYGRPPAGSRFQPGRSGNPKGRPRGRKTGLPYEAVLGQLVTIREDGVERSVTAAEAFLLHMTKSGLAGDGPAGRAAMAALETARAARGVGPDGGITVILLSFASPDNAVRGLQALRIAKKHDAMRPTVRMKIEPWAVEAALARFGDRRLTIAEQAEVWRATRTPGKVRWPDWWEMTAELAQTMPRPPPVTRRIWGDDALL